MSKLKKKINPTVEEYQRQIDELVDKRDEKMNKINILECDSFDDWVSKMEPEQSKINQLSRKKRLIEQPMFVKIPEYGDHMTLEHFISCCECGGFIDSDGYGEYATKDQMTGIFINPSDITQNDYRKDFTHVVWFNK